MARRTSAAYLLTRIIIHQSLRRDPVAGHTQIPCAMRDSSQEPVSDEHIAKVGHCSHNERLVPERTRVHSLRESDIQSFNRGLTGSRIIRGRRSRDRTR